MRHLVEGVLTNALKVRETVWRVSAVEKQFATGTEPPPHGTLLNLQSLLLAQLASPFSTFDSPVASGCQE